jgi:hypothetical protein
MAENWLKGRKNISVHMNVCWDTVRKWAHEFGCPIHVLPNGRPVARASELDQWLESFGPDGRRNEGKKTRRGGNGETAECS